METKELRTAVIMLAIQSGYKKTGWQKRLAKKLKISEVQLSQALTGCRETPRSYEILTQAKKILMRKL